MKIRTTAIIKTGKIILLFIGILAFIVFSPIFVVLFMVFKLIDTFVIFENKVWKKTVRYVG